MRQLGEIVREIVDRLDPDRGCTPDKDDDDDAQEPEQLGLPGAEDWPIRLRREHEQ